MRAFSGRRNCRVGEAVYEERFDGSIAESQIFQPGNGRLLRSEPTGR
jgi:hypothetical protein